MTTKTTKPQDAHTPGPWSAQTPRWSDALGEYVALIQLEETGSVICKAFGCDTEEAEANARLIAAAPMMLAACEFALARESAQETVAGNGDEGLMSMLRAAIRAAKGE